MTTRRTLGIRMPTFSPPRLSPVDLHLVDSHGYRVTRIGKARVIIPGDYYIAIIGGLPYFGTFTKQHYGLNFDDGWGNVGHQFDPPGTNASTWTALWHCGPLAFDYAMKHGARRRRALRGAWARKKKARAVERATPLGWTPEHGDVFEFLEEYS